MKKLNIKPTTKKELAEKWNMPVHFGGELFIRCNAKGDVNWSKAPVYTKDELEQRGDYQINI